MKYSLNRVCWQALWDLPINGFQALLTLTEKWALYLHIYVVRFYKGQNNIYWPLAQSMAF